MPVFHKGALFYTGDAHAAQGDGEISGTAIETANTAIFQFILHKGKTLASPRAETPTHYITFGLDPDLDNAMQLARRRHGRPPAGAEGLGHVPHHPARRAWAWISASRRWWMAPKAFTR